MRKFTCSVSFSYCIVFCFVTAPNQDFQSLNTPLTFTSDQTSGSMQCTNLQVLDDNILEEAETLILQLQVANDSSVVTITTGAESALVTIGEDAMDGTDGK